MLSTKNTKVSSLFYVSSLRVDSELAVTLSEFVWESEVEKSAMIIQKTFAFGSERKNLDFWTYQQKTRSKAHRNAETGVQFKSQKCISFCPSIMTFSFTLLSVLLVVAVFNFIICVASKSISLFVVNLTIIIITQQPPYVQIISTFSVSLLYHRLDTFIFSALYLIVPPKKNATNQLQWWLYFPKSGALFSQFWFLNPEKNPKNLSNEDFTFRGITLYVQNITVRAMI